MCVYIFIYMYNMHICIYMCVYIYIYVYIYTLFIYKYCELLTRGVTSIREAWQVAGSLLLLKINKSFRGHRLFGEETCGV